MSTPVVPALVVDSAPANPQTGGLYTAATMNNIPAPARLDFGVETVQYSVGAHGTWVTGCEQPADDAVKGGARGDNQLSPSWAVWAADDCSLVGSSEDEAKKRASALLKIYEPVDVEKLLADALLDEAGTPQSTATAPDPIVAALGAIEEALGETGVAGVIHARRGLASLAAKHGLVIPGSVGKLLTPMGNVWAFGGGYGALGNTLVGTGPVTVHRSPEIANVGLGARRNERLAVAEREVSVAWEILTVAAATT